MYSLYEILEVSPRASDGVIRAAYRCLAQQWHPDKHAGDKAAEERMRQVNHAYAILSDPLQRARYDRTANLQGGTERRGNGRPAPAANSEQRTGTVMRPFVFRKFA